MSEEENSGIYAYEPKDKKRKSTLKILIIEAVILIIAIGAIVTLLVRNGVIDFNNFESNLPFLQNEQEVDIKVYSVVPGYGLKVVDKKGLIKLLTEWGVFGKTFNGGYGILGRTGETPVKTISVIFTSEEQPINQFVDENGEPYMSSVTNAAPGELKVNVHIGPFVLNDPKNENDLWRSLDFIFLTTMYNISDLKPKKQDNNFAKDLQEYFIEKNKNNKQYFEITKAE